MIVCSQTCFLNILTQLLDKDTILKATYYIADLTGPGNHPHLNPNRIENQMGSFEETRWAYSDDGQLVKTGNPVKSVDTLQKYHIMYTSGALNPTSLQTTVKMGPEIAEGRRLTPEERFVKTLYDPDVQSEIYNEIFYAKPRGNGLQVLIYTNDQLCTQFGWIVCEFMSKCFGADIMFLDAKYRTKIAKEAKFMYQGDKNNAIKFIAQLRDYQLIESFKTNMSKSNLRECVNNITTKLSVMNWAQLIHLHNLLWPMDPLPQGNYSDERLREIIMYKALGNRKPTAYDQLDNLCASDAFYNMAQEYDQY